MMESTKYLIVGGGVAGTTAAATIRQHDANGRIVIVSGEPHLLYSRVALPGYTRGKTSRERVFLRDEAFYRQHKLELWQNAQATALSLDDRVVTLADGRRVQFEKLLVATGGSPRPWKVPGNELPGVLPMRTIDQADEIIKRLPSVKHAVVVGGGFISLEHIQTLSQHGVATTVVIRDPYYWANVLDEESGKLMQQLFEEASPVRFMYGMSVAEVTGHDQVEGVVLADGKKMAADLVLVNIGIDLNTDWLAGSGLGIEHGVVVDEHLATDIEGIFAAGDVALFFDPLLGTRRHVGNWNNATAHGQVAGLNMVGQPTAIDMVSEYSISLFGKNISFVGQTTAHPSMTVVPRGSARSGRYGRILIRGDRVVGATLINRFPDRQPLERLISSRVRIAPYIADLADETISLKELADQLLAGIPTTTTLSIPSASTI